MLLFIISFLMVFVSSYFIVSVITPRKSFLGFTYLFLVAFAQVVLTFEVLSLFSAIKVIPVLVMNSSFLIGSIFWWKKSEKDFWSYDIGEFLRKIKNSFKLDKALIWLFVGFCILIISAIFLNFVMPITNGDAQEYHVMRSLFWVLQGNLKHFDTAEIRALCLPINSEIIYSWILLFLKKDVFLGFVSFFGYILTIMSVFNILGLMGYSTRKKMWVIFILSSFSSVLVQASSTETDIIIAGLIGASIFLFWYALKNNKMMPLFMASLAYALAIGTKTTALIAIPSVAIFMMFLANRFKNFKMLFYFVGFGFLNFFIFSSYNYILNFIDFHNFISPQSFTEISKNYFGIQSMFINFIRYIFMFFDFTGFKWGFYLTPNLDNLQNSLLMFLNLDVMSNGLNSLPSRVGYSSTILEPIMGAGVLGFLVFLPCWLFSLISPVFKFKSKKTIAIFMFGVVLIINLLIMGYLLVYMTFSIRFMMAFIAISSPILVYSYVAKNNPFKFVIVLFAIFYLALVSTHLWARPFFRVIQIWKDSESLTYMRNLAICENYDAIPKPMNPICQLNQDIRKFAVGTKILALVDSSDDIYLLKALEFEGYKIDFRTLENIKNIDFNQYNLMIIKNMGQISTVIKNYGIPNVIPKTISCSYLNNSKQEGFIASGETYPFQVTCKISNQFLQEHNFEFIENAGIIKPLWEEADYYKVYRNTKLQLKAKK